MDQWWEPKDHLAVWPAQTPRDLTLHAFQAAFAAVGFAQPANQVLESGLEKVALYISNGMPVHAARQLANGWWTSKIGQYWDIEHETLEALEGKEFGSVACILARAGEAAPPIGPPEDYFTIQQN